MAHLIEANTENYTTPRDVTLVHTEGPQKAPESSQRLLIQARSRGFAAEDGGFEPPRACTQHAFQACAIGH